MDLFHFHTKELDAALFPHRKRDDVVDAVESRLDILVEPAHARFCSHRRRQALGHFEVETGAI